MEITERFLTPNTYSRPQYALNTVDAFVVHWVENPRTTAMFNRNWWELLKNGMKDSKGNYIYGSAHYAIDPETIIQCIPLNETARHIETLGKYTNMNTIGIELCHIDWEGRFDPRTLDKAVDLLKFLCDRFKKDPKDDIIRHFDASGKLCPKWFIDHPEDFELFKGRIYGLSTTGY
jgi:N-acetylmuramoyl-L-alanine amidase CwlA